MKKIYNRFLDFLFLSKNVISNIKTTEHRCNICGGLYLLGVTHECKLENALEKLLESEKFKNKVKDIIS